MAERQRRFPALELLPYTGLPLPLDEVHEVHPLHPAVSFGKRLPVELIIGTLNSEKDLQLYAQGIFDQRSSTRIQGNSS